MRIIIVSEALRATQAERSQKKFKDLFDGKFVFTNSYYDNGQGKLYPEFYIVRIPEKNEPLIDGHEMEVDESEILSNPSNYARTKASKVEV